jgi:hypothetical protein
VNDRPQFNLRLSDDEERQEFHDAARNRRFASTTRYLRALVKLDRREQLREAIYPQGQRARQATNGKTQAEPHG